MNEKNKNKARFFRWRGVDKHPFFFHFWMCREDGTAAGILFNGKREEGSPVFGLRHLEDNPNWEEIPASEGFLIF